jgi:hypothetical protein
VWETRDPDGRDVILDRAAWSHVLARHPHLGVAPEVVLAAVALPDARASGRRPGEEWYYLRGAGPSSWIKVVVHYEHGGGVIVTAFPRRSFP